MLSGFECVTWLETIKLLWGTFQLQSINLLKLKMFQDRKTSLLFSQNTFTINFHHIKKCDFLTTIDLNVIYLSLLSLCLLSHHGLFLSFLIPSLKTRKLGRPL